MTQPPEPTVDGDLPPDGGDLPPDDLPPDDETPGAAQQASEPSESAGAGLLAAVREIVLVLVIALGLSLVIKTFFVQAFYIPSESMQTVLEPGDRVLVSKLSPGPFSLHRGDVVVFADPGNWLNPAPAPAQGPVRSAVRNTLTFVGLLPSDSGEHLIKRVIGLPGDTVACCDPVGKLTVNGKAVDEPYLFPDNRPSDVDFTVTVPTGRLWVMGDHRSLSEDSRFHRDEQDGTVPVSAVVGRAFVVVWPFGRAHWLGNPSATFADVPAGR